MTSRALQRRSSTPPYQPASQSVSPRRTALSSIRLVYASFPHVLTLSGVSAMWHHSGIALQYMADVETALGVRQTA